MIAAVPRMSRTKAWSFVVLVLLAAVVGGVSFLGWRQSIARVKVTTPPPRLVGHKTTFPLVVEAARGQVVLVEVRAAQGGKTSVITKTEGRQGRRAEIPVSIDSAAAGLREGPVTLEVWARDDVWRPLRFDDRPVASFPVTIDLTPPKLELLASTQYVSPGGVGLVAFRVTGASASEVRVGSLVFPSYPMGAGDPPARIALFALPFNLPAGTPMTISTRDEAGNVAQRGIPSEVKPRAFRHDRIQLRDGFMQEKVAELLPQYPPSQPILDGFLVINRDQRKQAEETKRKIGAGSADKPLWQGAFVQPRNTKVFANFAETRTYIYNGREVDTQVHYGYDLASTRQSPVPAANKGVVAFAGPLTIYGNAVILDHGLGLQTLYGHLSSIAVKVGDAVDKGQELGRSGATGLALGDHLHYEVLVHGISVTPLEWWDAKWIRDHVDKPLKAAGLPEIGGSGDASASADSATKSDDAAAQPAPRPRRRHR